MWTEFSKGVLGSERANGKKEARVILSSAQDLECAFPNSALPGHPPIKWGKMITKLFVYWGPSQPF